MLQVCWAPAQLVRPGFTIGNMRHLNTLALLTLTLTAPAWAQSGPAVKPETTASGPVEPRIEQIRVEDDKVRIDELRVGGQTQSITVQPKNMPAYDVGTQNGNRNPATDNNASGQTGTRGWKVLGF